MGESDCEMLRDGWLAQPVNAWSSAAFLAVGACVLLRWHRAPRAVRAPMMAGGVALASVAFGSAAFHGPQPPWADVAHDGSIAALLIVFVVRRPGGFGSGGIAAGVGMLAAALTVLSVSPGSEVVVHAPLVAAAAVVEWRRLRAASTVPSSCVAALVSLAAGVVLLVAGRSGGPLCAPTSPVQAHAGWHVLSAVAAGSLLGADGRSRATATPTPC